MSIPIKVYEDTKLTQTVHELALEGYQGPGKPALESREKYRWLRKHGSKLWLDTGDAGVAEQVWAAELDALTTNNTLVNQIVKTGSMDGDITYAARLSDHGVEG
ncbi:MAG: hypothetical protein Q7N50_08055 [Armatimonadota bacterium]|nr:hypothetical protein [Armatimonadota bacterium]